jgi:hypothetical protein
MVESPCGRKVVKMPITSSVRYYIVQGLEV